VHVAVINPGVIRTEIFDKGPEFDHLRHVVEPQLLGTEVVTRSIAKAIEKERFELFAPARYTIIWKLRALFPRAVMKGSLQFVEKKFLRPPATPH
jgi:short-subunit dehydrogenase